MNKVQLERFIAKYNLGGQSEAVKWVSNAEGLHIHFSSEFNDLIGLLDTPQIKLAEGEYNIFETRQLIALLSVLGEDIDVKVMHHNHRAVGFSMTDGMSKVVFALSDPAAIPKVPVMKKDVTEWDVQFVVDQKFREAFIRARSALKDSETFTVLSDGTTAQIVLGYNPDANQHNVSISPATATNNELSPINFDANHLVSILSSNKEMPDTVLSFSRHKIGHVSFHNDQFSAKYYLFQKHR